MTFSSSKNSDHQQPLTRAQQPVESNRPEPDQTPRYYPGTVEFSAPLETSVPLEAPRPVHTSPSGVQPPLPEPGAERTIEPIPERPLEKVALEPELIDNQVIDQTTEPIIERTVASSTSPLTENSKQVSVEEKIQLLAERVVVDLHRRKVGEVVVRKEVETRIIEVPIRLEKLIVEQVSPEHKQLAIVDLGQGNTELDVSQLVQLNAVHTVSGKFTSPDAAIQFLETLKAQSGFRSQAVQISIIPEDAGSQAVYERLLAQSSSGSIA